MSTLAKVLTMALVSAAPALGCGADTSPKAPSQSLARFEGQQMVLFDDTIDPAALGLSMDGLSPAQNPHLRSRALEADLVSRMRIQTITRDVVGAKTMYTVTLQVAVPPLMPARLELTTFDILVHQHDPAFGMVQKLDSDPLLRRATFVGFVRRFADAAGPKWHWHLTADQENVIQVIQEIAMLDQVAGESSPGNQAPPANQAPASQPPASQPPANSGARP
jgi:hypothetical protein